MAYNLPMMVNLQLDAASAAGIVKQVESAFGKINLGKSVDAKSFVKVNTAIQKTTKQLEQGQKKAQTFWDTLEGKARSGVAYTLVSTALLKVTGAISQATREAVKYETELLKISQVTGDSVKLTKDYSNRLTDISKKYNVTLSKVAQLTRTLTQTGLSFREAAKGADILARTSLLATFDSLTSTTEGLIAVMNTFEISVSRAGQVLESINTVSKKFAVESSDIVEAIRRTGGAFSAAGGQVEELISLFTAVRSTSRESAETIATGFRTIFGRLQRPKTIEYFKQLGVQLENAEGQFIGPYEAIRRISEALQFKGIQAGSTKFAEVVEQIGGIRQISRVVPLLTQFEKSQRALGFANNASADSIEDLEKAQKGLGFQLGQLQKEFGALISDIVNSPSFKFLADIFINSSKAVLRLVGALKPLLPILASVAAFKLGRGLTKLLSGGFSLKGVKEATGFARGGMVPGSGNGDTVPAMLTPGEFVVRKSAVQAYGADRLAKINKYANGGYVERQLKGAPGSLRSRTIGYSDIGNLNISNSGKGAVAGYFFEDFVSENYNVKAPDTKFPDIPRLSASQKSQLGLGYKEFANIKAAELKYRKGIRPNFNKQFNEENTAVLYAEPQGFNKGGAVGTDTVPALLTPGEYVINKKSAQAFGYGNLEDINRYENGGVVLSKKEKKRRREEFKAKEDAKAGGTGLTRQEKFDAGKATKSLISLAKDDITAKYEKLLQEEKAMMDEQYKKRAAQIEEQGGSVLEIFQKQMKALDEYNAILAEAKAGFEASANAELKGESKKIKKEVTDSFVKEKEMAAAKEAEAAEKAAKALEDAGKKTKSFGDKIKSGASSTYDGLAKLNVSFPEAIMQVQSFASGLKVFGGFDINQEALTQGQVKGGALSGAGEAVKRFADPAVIKGFGSQLNKVGKMLPKSIGGPVRKLGGVLLKNGASIAKGAAMAAKGLNVLSYIELGGGLVDALFSTDYGKQRDNLIALGDAAGAATAAAQAYSQEQYRAIPIIGGFLSAMGFGSNATEDDLDATGKLVVANAKLEASLNGVDREVNKAKGAFQRAASVGDKQGQKDAINAQLDAIDAIKNNAEDAAAKTQALQASGASSMGSGSSMLKGAAGGAIGGAAIGAMIGSVFPVIGTAIGAGVGALVGAATGAAAAWWSSSKLAKDQIIKGYELQGEAAKKYAEIMSELIEGFTGNLASEAARMVRGGKGYAEALEKVTDDFGGEAQVKRLLGGKQLTGDLETDIGAANEAVAARDAEVMQLKQQASLLKDSQKEKKAELEAQIAAAEGEQQKAAALRDGLVQTQAAIVKEKQLEERRAVQAKAMEYQIALMKEMQSAYDGFNATMREANNIAEEANNIGTNRLTTRQAAEMSGVSDSRIYEMGADEIVRNNDVASQMAARVGVNTMRGQEIIKGQDRVNTIDRIQSDVVGTGALDDIYANVQQGETADAKQIQDAIYDKLGITAGADPILDEEIRQYSERIAKEGLSAAGQAAQEAREGATEQSRKIIEEQQKIDQQLFEQQKKLREMQIELTQKQMANAQQAYDNEKEYFEKRSALANKVDDFLNPIQEGPGKAAAIAARGAARTGAARQALGARRRKQFGEVGLGGADLGQAVNTVSSGFQAAGEASEELKGQMDALMSTIQDEIQIEQEYLDTLIETAKAQQEYTQALNDAQGDLVRDLVTGTEEEVGNQLMTMNAAAMAAQQGSFAGIPEEMKKDVFALFDQFGDVEIPGLGMTGRDAQREITKNELMRNFGYDEQTASKLASKAVKDKVPVDERMAEQIKAQEEKIAALLEYEKQLKDAQLAQERENTQLFAQKVEEFAAAVNTMAAQAGQPVAATATGTGMGMAASGAMGGAGQGAAIGGAIGSTGVLGLNSAVGTGLGAAAGAAAGAMPGLMFAADAATGGGASRAMNALGGFAQNAAGALFGGLAQQPTDVDAAAAGAAATGLVPGGAAGAANAGSQPLPTYGLTPSQQRYAEDKINLKKRQEELIAKRQSEGLTSEETKKLSKTSNALMAAQEGLSSTGASETDVELYQQAYQARQNEMRAADQSGNRPVTPNDGSVQQPPSGGGSNQNPNNQNNAPSNNTTAATGGAGGQQQPIQVQTQGQQDITVRLPDIQALVNQQITALVFETVGNKFNQVAEDVRTADNFDDVANALSGGISEQSQQQV